ncbi:MAG: ABC transporter ATP-binding protein [Huintestinicola sp.]|uniref:ABC transporter ATP-binding protein n=1 Tax=Huintestinicola sp. TaxID=2981661 RepID=UPI003F01DC73
MIEISNASMIFENDRAVRFGKKDTEGYEHRDKALDDVSLTIPDGCIYGFLGSNGAGKSTLMRMICGVYKTDMGSIKIDGQEVYDNPEAKKNIFFVNDETIEYTSYTLSALKNYYSNYYDTFDSDTYNRLLGVLKLPETSPLSTFSKGMKRQAVAMIGLACHTKYLMLDEAFDGLDPAMRAVIKDMILEETRSRSATLIISSHNIREIGELCDRAMLIHSGKLVFADEITNIKSRFRKLQLASLSHTMTSEEITAADIDIMQYKAEGRVVQVIVRDSEGLDEKVSKLGAELYEQIPLTLEEIFIYEMNLKGYGQ